VCGELAKSSAADSEPKNDLFVKIQRKHFSRGVSVRILGKFWLEKTAKLLAILKFGNDVCKENKNHGVIWIIIGIILIPSLPFGAVHE
jgi:hypothetical protein